MREGAKKLLGVLGLLGLILFAGLLVYTLLDPGEGWGRGYNTIVIVLFIAPGLLISGLLASLLRRKPSP